MTKVSIRARGLDQPVTLDIGLGHVALVGRDPDKVKIAKSELPVGPSYTVKIPSSHVSSLHCVLWRTVQGVFVRDLQSRNGTWLKLAAGVDTPTGDREVSLELARSESDHSTQGKHIPFASVTWSDSSEFGSTMKRVVSDWLTVHGMDHSITLKESPIADTERSHGRTASFALANGESIVIQTNLDATMDTRWGTLLDRVAGFIAEQNNLIDQEQGHDDGFVIRSTKFRMAHQKVFDAAVRGRRLLLLGPSGAGKERLAECYHRHSRRHEAAFKPVHCGLMDKDLIWVQLFGATRGSYTGSVRDVVGAVESAHGGTIFLDEVAELSPRMQAALLRFLDRKGEYERLGEGKTRYADVQVVCATNLDLRSAVAKGTFREDLWYRFAGSVVEVPGLKDRPEDVIAFLQSKYVSMSMSMSMSRKLSVHDALSIEAKELVLKHQWPGNFRELDNFASRLPSVSKPGTIDARTVKAALAEGTTLRGSEGAQEKLTLTSQQTAQTDPKLANTWLELLQKASTAYQEDHHRVPEKLGELREFLDGYLKPVFVANGCDLQHLKEISNELNYSAFGRKLDIADGTTVKKCLQRYVERYGKS